ncbi:hypothetical protein IHE45_09G078600 [Dioscorea alata]|uniref:Uncharacterized protein n=1 Tax=Dioscorea alata TaxID=55571 RepID=A0ACB7VG75_DIOAL|nr:hypothetical protein IHE45_09G078600 [Dioscorea alata]
MEENIAAAASHQSVNWNQEISTSNLELNRKRKLQYELSLPLPKHKFRNKSNTVSSDHELEKHEDNTKHSSTETFHEEDQSPTSSSSCNNIYSLDSRLNIKEQKADSEEDKEFKDENEELMIYSNEFMVSETSSARKPTVDQEFEQYFSMLMI